MILSGLHQKTDVFIGWRWDFDPAAFKTGEVGTIEGGRLANVKRAAVLDQTVCKAGSAW